MKGAKLDPKIKLDGGKRYEKSGKNPNQVQKSHPWLPKVAETMEFIHPHTGKPTYFNYNRKLKEVIADMVVRVAIFKMIRLGIFQKYDDEFCKTFYSNLTSTTFVNINRSIMNWNPSYDIFRYCQLMCNYANLSIWSAMKEERKTIHGILDGNLSMSYMDSMQLFEKFCMGVDDESTKTILDNIPSDEENIE